MRYVPTQNGLSSAEEDAAARCTGLDAEFGLLVGAKRVRCHRFGPLGTHGVHGRAERERGSWYSASWVLGRQDCLPLCSEGSRVAVLSREKGLI